MAWRGVGRLKLHQIKQLVAELLARLRIDRLHLVCEQLVLRGIEFDDLAALRLHRGLGVFLFLDVQSALEGDSLLHETLHRGLQHWFPGSVLHQQVQQGQSRRAVSADGLPLLGASSTTALGLLSLATSNVQAVRQFGIGSAAGVMVDFVMSIVFLPTLLTLVKPDTAPPPQERWLAKPMGAVAGFASQRLDLHDAVGDLGNFDFE